MTHEPNRTTARFPGRLAIAALLAVSGAARAQDAGSVQDYQLPQSSPSPRAAGPVDTDHPTAAPNRPAAAPSPAPTITPAPMIALPPAASVPVTGPAAPRGERTARPLPSPQTSPAATPVPPEPAPPDLRPSAPIASDTAPLSPAPPPEAATTTAAEPQMIGARGELPWLWIAAGAAALVVLGLLLAWRSRAKRREPIDWEAPTGEAARAAEAEHLPEPSPPATLTPPDRLDRSPPTPTPAPPPAPTPPSAPRPARALDMQLEARHLSRAMINATLAYRLTVTNGTPGEIGPLRIAGDIVSAHASLSAAEQLAPADAALATVHEIPVLAPGESVSLSGELRMPIASILPIHSGSARVFVPLARFRADTAGEDRGNDVAVTRVFVIGQESEHPGGGLRPFPLDRGPGVDRGLGQRELEVPA